MAEKIERIEFTKEMKKDYTILIPNMLDIHFRFLVNVFRRNGYNVELLTDSGPDVRKQGVKYVHNDTCYPALLTIGQMISALKSGKYDLNKVALIMSQTGGGCRASNYIHLLRKALANAGMAHIPVISLNLSGMEKNAGFQLTLPMLRQAFAALIFGDCLTLLNNQTRPYEVNYGESENLVGYWVKTICEMFEKGGAVDRKSIRTLMTRILESFEKIKIAERKKVRVGIVGEIYVKYSPLANNDLEKFLFDQGCEVNVPGILAFLLFKVDNRLEDIELYGGSGLKKIAVRVMFNYLRQFEEDLLSVLAASARYAAPASYARLKEIVAPYIGHGCKMAPDRGDARTDRIGLRKYRLRPAVRLPSESYRREGNDPGDPGKPSRSQYRRDRLRSRRDAGQSGKPDQTDARDRSGKTRGARSGFRGGIRKNRL